MTAITQEFVNQLLIGAIIGMGLVPVVFVIWDRLHEWIKDRRYRKLEEEWNKRKVKQ